MRIIRAILLVAVLAGALHFTMMGISATRVAMGDMHHATGQGDLADCPMGYVCPFGTLDLTSIPAAPAVWSSLFFAIVTWGVVASRPQRLAHGPPIGASPAAHVRRLLTVLKRE